MHVHLEPANFVARVLNDGETYGSPPEWAAALRIDVETKSVKVMIAEKAPSDEALEALFDKCRSLGIETITFGRSRPGGVFQPGHEIKVPEVPQEAAR